MNLIHKFTLLSKRRCQELEKDKIGALETKQDLTTEDTKLFNNLVNYLDDLPITEANLTNIEQQLD